MSDNGPQYSAAAFAVSIARLQRCQGLLIPMSEIAGFQPVIDHRPICIRTACIQDSGEVTVHRGTTCDVIVTEQSHTQKCTRY